ncbi:Protein_disulfide isomerase PDI3 [Hexamita inflata]|uniref:Protein_disulfide isomerase PDI3 n=1 Tax=Hexamita inflata TaxID=28002 RepID=A0ABP1GKF2_9EUKA
MIFLQMTSCFVFDITKRIDKSMTKHNLMIVKYTAPWCLMCRNFDDQFDQLSSVISKDSLYFAEVNCIKQEEYCLSQGVVKFPTFVMYGEPIGMKPQKYEGNLQSNELLGWIKDILDKLQNK